MSLGCFNSNNVEVIQSVKFAIGFHRLLLRSWFYRTWIVQEFVLAKFPPKFVCGTKSITSGQFLAAHASIDGARKPQSPFARDLNARYRHRLVLGRSKIKN